LANIAIPVFEEHADDRALGRAWLDVAATEGAYYCRYAQAEEAARKALLHYRRAGWPVSACLGTLAASLLNGPTPVSSAIPECEQLLDGADLNGEANVLPFLAALQAMKGDFEQAREQLRR